MPGNLEKAKIAITIKYIDEHARRGPPAEPDDIMKNLLSAAAEMLLGEAKAFDDKQSIVHCFFKMVGLQHMQLVADHGLLPAVDDAAKAMLYNGLLATLRAHLEQQLAQ